MVLCAYRGSGTRGNDRREEAGDVLLDSSVSKLEQVILSKRRASLISINCSTTLICVVFDKGQISRQSGHKRLNLQKTDEKRKAILLLQDHAVKHT